MVDGTKDSVAQKVVLLVLASEEFCKPKMFFSLISDRIVAQESEKMAYGKMQRAKRWKPFFPLSS